jgi:Cu(I)/Ag(I) efflux system membrane protein CusA/SilA
MSLGGIAIAIGTMIDAGIVMVENAHKHLERDRDKKPRREILIDAAVEVGPSLFFSLLIVTASFLPIFALEAQEGRLFKPLAFTKTYAMAGAALLSITVVPALMIWLVRGKIRPESRNPLNRAVLGAYRPLLAASLRHRFAVLAVAVLLLLSCIYPYRQLGSEFMPPLNEGDLLYMPTTLPGDPAPLSMIETIITLKPQSEWRPGMTPQKLIEELDSMIRFPGLTNAWTMPIKTRLDMLATGIKTPVGIKISGPDLKVLEDIGEQIEATLRKVPGTLTVYSERVIGGNYLDFDIDRARIARYGLTIGDVQDVIQTAIGGMNISQTVEGLERYPINLRYSRELRDDLSSLRRVLVPTPSGARVPLEQLASLNFTKGPPAIKTENARPNALVFIDLEDIDVGTYVEKARATLAEHITIPPGYTVQWSGQYEYLERAQNRLMLIAPLTLGIIFLLLYLNFRRLSDTLLVIGSLPFALVGGLYLLWALDYDLSVAVGAGFLALLGLTAETGVIMLLFLNQARDRAIEAGKLETVQDLWRTTVEGATFRARPLLMTVASDVIGLLPIMWGAGTGSETMRRIAAPMVGGVITASLVTLIVIPVLFTLVHGWGLPSGDADDQTRSGEGEEGRRT